MRLHLLLGCGALACASEPGSEQSAGPTSTTGAGVTTTGANGMGGASTSGVSSTGTTTASTATTGVTSSAATTTAATTGGATVTTSGGGGSTAATATDTSTTTSTSGGGSGGSPSEWHAATAPMLTEELLSAEYENWKTRHVQTCADGSAIVVKDGSVVSEGIAYGMLLAVGFLDRPLFDGLWQYYSDHLDANGLMNWATSLCESAGDNNANAATDAELDAAMALIQAQARWPDGAYLAAAEDLTQRILTYETDLCDDKLVLLPGDAWGGCNDSDTRINPSYFAPGYYRVFAAAFPAQAEQWNELVENTYALYAAYQALFPLVPDWDNHPYGDEGSIDHYNYDACRTPWRVATEYAWSGDSRAASFLQDVSGWVDANGGIGSPGGRANNSAFNGAFALAGVTDAAKLDGYVSAWLSSGGDDGPYFQGTLRVIYMLLGAGRFPSTL